MLLRLMQEIDLPAILTIETLCFTSPWTKDMLLYELVENEFGNFYVLYEDETLVGYIDFWITFEVCQLANLAIHPTYQGKGYSRLLMDTMIKIANTSCETISLEVRVSNKRAQRLYASYTFIECHKRKGYYSDNGEDASVMCKALGGDTI